MARSSGQTGRALGFTIADQILASGSNIVLNIVLARWLTIAQFGAFSILFSTFTLVAGLHGGLILEPMSVFSGALFRGRLQSYNKHLIRMHAAFASVSIPVLWLIGRLLVPPYYSSIAFGACLLSGIATVLLYYLLRRMAYASRNYGTALIAGGVSISCALGCLWLIKVAELLSWTTAFLTQSIAGIAAAVFLYIRSLRSGTPDHGDKIDMRSALTAHWQYGRWAVATALVFWLSAEAYHVLIGLVLDPSEVAGFRVVQNLCMLLPNFVTALSVLALPRAAALYADTGARCLRQVVISFGLASAAGSVALATVLMIAGIPILAALYGPSYSRYSMILPALACNLIVITISQAVQMGVRAMNAPRAIFESFLAAALCTCTGGYILTRLWGLRGASVGLCISSAMFFFVLLSRFNALCRAAVANPLNEYVTA